MTSMLIVNHVLKISIVFAVAAANIVNDPWKMCCLVYKYVSSSSLRAAQLTKANVYCLQCTVGDEIYFKSHCYL